MHFGRLMKNVGHELIESAFNLAYVTCRVDHAGK